MNLLCAELLHPALRKLDLKVFIPLSVCNWMLNVLPGGGFRGGRGGGGRGGGFRGGRGGFQDFKGKRKTFDD